jgi:hypothetical protein
MSVFYVGYLPKAPSDVARFVRRVIACGATLMGIAAVVLPLAQAPFTDSAFEYLQYKPHEGMLSASPYPTLHALDGSYLLVRPGKHGAGKLLDALDRRSVRVQGALVRSGEQRMLEIDPSQFSVLGAAPLDPRRDGVSNQVTLVGEIVDSKCHFGVMNPGNGKTHRSCATRCISGGIPPAFLVRDSRGDLRTFVLADAAGKAVRSEVLDYIAEPVELSGRVRGSAFLAELASIRRVRE